MIPRLGVNIDHVATLRQARGEEYPGPMEAAKVCLEHGADQITIHLREDRRHIQDTDVPAIQMVTKRFGKPLNLEMGCHSEIIEIAIATNPEWVCLVPEKREEKTTEGGLDLLDDLNFKKVMSTCDRLKKHCPNGKISLFLEANQATLLRASELPIDAVEIHTGEFARKFLIGENYQDHIDSFKMAKELLEKKNLGCHAGHGLTLESTQALVAEKLFVEYNIGHWIISRAIFEGLDQVVKKFVDLFQRAGRRENI